MIQLPDEQVKDLLDKRKKHNEVQIALEALRLIIFLYFYYIHQGKPGSVITFISGLYHPQLAAWKKAFPDMENIIPYTLISTHLFIIIELAALIYYYNKYYILSRTENSPGVKMPRLAFIFVSFAGIPLILFMLSIFVDPLYFAENHDSWIKDYVKFSVFMRYIWHSCGVYSLLLLYLVFYSGFRSIREVLLGRC